MTAGEKRLLEGDESGLQLLATASELDPENTLLFHKQGLAIFDYACNGHPKALHTANQKFKRATILKPDLFETWVSWGNSLFILGSTHAKHHYFLEAKEKFEQAILLSEGKPDLILLDLYWNYGLTVGRIALHSEDPHDLQIALNAFEKVLSYKQDQPCSFWCDYGHLNIGLFHALGAPCYLQQAIKHYKQAACLSESDHMPWVFLGDAGATLFGLTHESMHFDHANECYAAAVAIQEDDASVWIKWASILSTAGRQMRDPIMLHACIEKCRRAKSLQADAIELTCVWAEALSTLGTLKNRLKHLKRSEEMMYDLSLNHSQNAAVHYTHGIVLLAQGDYFNCIDIYLRAVESFQKATSIDRTFHAAWHAMGTAYMILASLEDDAELQLERAIRFFSKALKLKNDPGYHYDLGHVLYLLADGKESSDLLSRALYHIEEALHMQQNASYVHTDWLFTYAAALSLSGHLNDTESDFTKALDQLHDIVSIDPTFPQLNYRFALTYNYYADQVQDTLLFQKAFHHFRIAHQHDPDQDAVLVDWAISLIHLYELDGEDCHLDDAESKLIAAAKMGNTEAFYTLAGLYGLRQQAAEALFYLEKSEKFGSLPLVSEVVDDVWFESLHHYPEFHTFIANAQKRQESSD